jgi:4-hydroxy-3-polyprenylbenzoate decarboxylase
LLIVEDELMAEAAPRTGLRRIVVAITGATGVVYGIRTLEMLKTIPEVETHLIVSKGARATIKQETDLSQADLRDLADVTHGEYNLTATISSGSFQTSGMIVAPCSIKTLSGIVNSFDENLVVRAADVVLKENRRLVLLVRETPLHRGHLELMLRAAKLGAVIMPPVPAFYCRPVSLDDVVKQTVSRVLDQFGIAPGDDHRWPGSGDCCDRSLS